MSETKIECKVITKEQEEIILNLEKEVDRLLDNFSESFSKFSRELSPSTSPYEVLKTVYYCDMIKDFQKEFNNLLGALKLDKEIVDDLTKKHNTSVENAAMNAMMNSVTRGFKDKSDVEILDLLESAIKRAKEDLKNKDN